MREVELELGADNGKQSECLVLLDDATKHRARGDLVGRSVGLVDIGDRVGDALLPRHRADGGGIEARHHVGEAVLQAAVTVENITTRGGHPGGLAEGGAVTGRTLELRHGDVL